MTIGTIGSFAVIILANNNDKQDQIQATTEAESIAKQQEDAAKANAANSEGFDGYTARTFDAAAVTALGVETLVQGTGDTIKATDSINSSYFGWISDGTIFDSSKKKNASDDAPITFPLSGVIQGWTQGLTGVKVGSVVRLSIPADLAYGPSGSGVIPANSPLEFIVKINKIDNSTATQ
jgi:FKBP-type peptidyl-prolyl cis-trans isomerase FkpA/FKBP-type peptidyl-prolyl cis-trans isomerase FklB